MINGAHTWNLKEYYENERDDALERDVRSFERAHARFEAAHRPSGNYLKSVRALKAAIEDYEALMRLGKPFAYLRLSKSVDVSNKAIDAKISLCHERLARAGNRVLFFRHSLGRLSKGTQEKFLRSSDLRPFHRFLKRAFDDGMHLLSEGEEGLLNELRLPARDMWTDLTERLQDEKTVEFSGTKIPLSFAQSRLSSLRKTERDMLWKALREEYKKDASVAEAEINALYIGKAILDRRRRFREPYNETLLDFETEKAELDALRASVDENTDIAHMFYSLTRRELNLKKLSYADRAASIGSFSTRFSFDRAIHILRELFSKHDKHFADLFEEMLAHRRIDAFPRKGKVSGGFCSGAVDFPTHVLLNYTDTLNSLSTFAHEMGHAIHTELAKSERPLYQNYSIVTAEFASTFFEELLFSALEAKLSKSEQKTLLHMRLSNYISTTFRQMAFFEFELALHKKIQSVGYVPKEEIAELLNEKTKAYVGASMELEKDDGYFFVPLSHVRRFFYVYSYAYGELLSLLVARRALRDPDVFQGVLSLFSSGSSASPRTLFKRLGYDTTKKETFTEAFGMIREDLARLKNL